MNRFLLILFIQSVLFSALSGQCPDRDFLWNRIIYLRDIARPPEKEQLSELLNYLEKMSDCPYKNDSTHSFLLQRIGWLCAMQKDFARAIQYTQQSMNIIYKNQKNPSV